MTANETVKFGIRSGSLILVERIFILDDPNPHTEKGCELCEMNVLKHELY